MGRLDGQGGGGHGREPRIGAEIARLFAAEGGAVVCAARHAPRGRSSLPGSLGRRRCGDPGRRRPGRSRHRHIAEPAECEQLIRAAAASTGPWTCSSTMPALTYYLPVRDYRLEQVDAFMGGELPRAVRPEPARPRRHDPETDRRHRQHLVGRGDWPRRGPYSGRGGRWPRQAPATAPRRPRSSRSPRPGVRGLHRTASP